MVHETNRIEFKRELNTNVDIEKEVIAFLNYHEGGTIYIGIDKTGQVVGVSKADGDILKIKDRIKNNISPSAMGLNAIVHNGFAREVPPKFEIFSDRIEITSAGTLPEDLSEDDFFNGVSIPRNRELMRVYRDLELVEQLGSGVPRILESYGRECFRFMDNFIRMTFPASEQVTPQVTELINIFEGIHNRTELQTRLGLLDREHFRKSYLQPAIDAGLVALTIPDKPTSSKQRYVLTETGKQIKKNELE